MSLVIFEKTIQQSRQVKIAFIEYLNELIEDSLNELIKDPNSLIISQLDKTYNQKVSDTKIYFMVCYSYKGDDMLTNNLKIEILMKILNILNHTNMFNYLMNSQVSETLSGHSAIGAILCNNQSTNKKTDIIHILLKLGYKPTSKDLQIAQINFYDSLTADDKMQLICIIAIFNYQDFCKVIIRFLIDDLILKYTTYLPNL